MTSHLAERLCWEVARRDDGALLDAFFHVLQAIGVMGLLETAYGAAIHCPLVPFVQYVRLCSMKTLLGMESIKALPSLLFSDEALMRQVGFNAQQGRQGICRRGATKRQGERLPGPIWPSRSNGAKTYAIASSLLDT